MSEFSELFGEWSDHADGTPVVVKVEAYKGAGSRGPVYEPAVTVEGAVAMPQNRLVINSDGNEVQSATVVYAPPESAGLLKLHARVTVDSNPSGTIQTLGLPNIAGLFDFVAANLG